MAIRGLSMDSTVEYVSKRDPAKGTEREMDDGTRFILGTLTSRVEAAIKDKSTAFRRDKEIEEGEDPEMMAEFRPNESTYLYVQFGLKGWKNLLDDADGEIAFKTVERQLGGHTYTVVAPESMDCLGLDLIRELGEQIEKLNTSGEEEAKSSGE